MRPSSQRPGALVLSLDLELHWGVRDRVREGHPYVANLLGVRSAVDGMLALFSRHDAACTWATVGALFARDRDELERFSPVRRPRYEDTRLDPWAERVGHDHKDDPIHFGADLVERIHAAPHQELGTHTFSHFYCLASGQTAEDFRSDLQAAVKLAATWGITLRSIVLPRNQVNPRYASVLREVGITAYRGSQRAWMYAPRDRELAAARAARLVDAYAPLAGDHLVDWKEVVDADGLACVRASMFLRPWSHRLRALEPLRRRRLRAAVRRAARDGQIFHLWWHPHNFGVHTAENLDVLDEVLDELDRCRERYGMASLTMGEVADRALSRAP